MGLLPLKVGLGLVSAGWFAPGGSGSSKRFCLRGGKTVFGDCVDEEKAAVAKDRESRPWMRNRACSRDQGRRGRGERIVAIGALCCLDATTDLRPPGLQRTSSLSPALP